MKEYGCLLTETISIYFLPKGTLDEFNICSFTAFTMTKWKVKQKCCIKRFSPSREDPLEKECQDTLALDQTKKSMAPHPLPCLMCDSMLCKPMQPCLVLTDMQFTGLLWWFTEQWGFTIKFYAGNQNTGFRSGCTWTAHGLTPICQSCEVALTRYPAHNPLSLLQNKNNNSIGSIRLLWGLN